MADIADGPLRRWYAGIMFSNEGQPHHRLRRLVGKAFTPQAVQTLRPVAAALIAEQLAPLKAAGDGDLFAALRHIPMYVMCDLLGVPKVAVPDFVAWVAALSPTFGVMTSDEIEAATAAITLLLDYVNAMLEERNHAPGDDLISALLHAEDDGDRLTRQETADMVVNLLIGGYDTTASQTACTLFTLLQRPELFDDARADPALIPLLVDETIRFEPAIGTAPRMAKAEFEVAGTVHPAGTVIFLATMTANRDPAVWADGDTFKARRFAKPDAPKLLTFGGGAHFCLGTWLARLVLEEVIRGVAELSPRLTVAPETIEWVSPLGQNPARLPVSVKQ